MQHRSEQSPRGPLGGEVAPHAEVDFGAAWGSAEPDLRSPIEQVDTERTRLPTRWQSLRHNLLGPARALLPVALCVILYASLFFLDLLSGTDLAVFGVRDEATEQRVLLRYGPLIRSEQVRILLAYLGLGLLVGVATSALAGFWEWSGAFEARVARREEGAAGQPLLRRTAMALLLALGFHAWRLCHAIASTPQIFTESLYDKGGLRRALMVALTHTIPSTLIDGLFIGTLLGLLAVPFLTPRVRGRLRRAFSRWFGAPVSGRAAKAPSWLRSLGVAAVVVTLTLSILFLQAGRDDARGVPPSVGQPSVLLIAVDSLRADRVDRRAAHIAPNLASLAERSVRFDAAHVTVPRTFPSFVTLLSGRYPHHHGIRNMFPSAEERAQVGPALPGIVSEAGLRSRVISDFCGEIFSRIDLGFTQVEVPYFDAKTIVRQRSVVVHPNLLPYVTGPAGRRIFPSLEALAELSDPDLLASRTIRALKEYKEQRQPFFLTVFFSSAHFPYAAPAPYYRRFTDPAYRGPFRYHKPPWAESNMTPEDEKQVRGLYNGAVAATDAAIGRLLRALSDMDLSRNTIVVLLADHGENLYDTPGRGMGHGDHLEGMHSLRIPLLIHDPVHNFPPHSVPGIVRDIDVAPTLLELLGLESTGAASAMDGVSLLPLLRGDKESLGLSALSETELWFTPQGPGFDSDNRLPYPGVTSTIDIDPTDDIFLSERFRDLVTVAKHRAVTTERFKLIYRPTRTGVHWTLFDLGSDPHETRDVSSRYPEEFSQLQAELLRFLADDPRAVVEGGYVIPR